ncbi:MAG: hypothetical protein ABSE48_06860 [Verrucomicrobiota bacterium]|jgi:hypothetical protein
MPIQINLLTEALAQEDSRKRDPVKRAIFGGALAVVMMLVWFSSILLEHMVATSNLARVQAEIQAHENDYNVEVADLKKINEVQSRVDELNKLSSARFLQGDLMNALQQLYVPNVCLLHVQVSQSYTPTGSGSVVEHTVLTLDAKDSSPNPGDQVNRCKEAINELSYFRTNLEASDGVKLFNLSPQETAPGSKPFVLFTIECHFADKTR